MFTELPAVFADQLVGGQPVLDAATVTGMAST